jgi:hypothetical protein
MRRFGTENGGNFGKMGFFQEAVAPCGAELRRCYWYVKYAIFHDESSGAILIG